MIGIRLAILIVLAAYHAALAVNNGVGRTPPMGFNTWNAFHCSIDEELVKDIAIIMTKNTTLSKLGYQYLNLDDCWQVSRNSDGVIVADPNRFPNGIKYLANYLHGLDLKFGLYSDAGTMTCGERPGSLNYEELDAKTYAEWGVDYLKYDNCFNNQLSLLDRYKKMSIALNNTGRPIFFSICEWGLQKPWEWAPAVGNSWRTSQDIIDKWYSIVYNMQLTYRLSPYAGPGGWNDPDMLEIGNGGLTYNESISHFSLWAIMKSPLLIGSDLRTISEQDLAILSNEEVIEVNQDPLGKQAKLVKMLSNNSVYVFNGELINNEFVILILNLKAYYTKLDLEFSDLGIASSDLYVSFRDAWLKKDIGVYKNTLSGIEIASHGVVMYRCKYVQ